MAVVKIEITRYTRKAVAKEMLSKGTLTRTSIDSRTVMKRALLNNAVSVIIAHNHPSGNPRPSESDIRQTRDFKEAGILLNIPLLDHLIITDGFFYSFEEEEIRQYRS